MILILSGIPGSGKTTLAHRWVAEDPNHRRRINADDIRVEKFGCKGPTYYTDKGHDKSLKFRESFVFEVCERRAADWLQANPVLHSVVIDNTNLTEGARSTWVKMGKELGIEVVQQDVDTPLSECLRRNRLRAGDDRVERSVIERMALFTGWIDWNDLPPKWQPSKGPDIVIVDIDGTLSDPSHRLHHVKPTEGFISETALDRFKPRWDLFHAEVDKDLPKPAIIELVRRLSLSYWIIIVSGRSPEHGCGIKTEEWLDNHLGIPYQHLFMRRGGDYKPDYEHKQEILDLLPKDRIAFVLDDRDQVVDMWRRNGLTCLQVAKGAF